MFSFSSTCFRACVRNHFKKSEDVLLCEKILKSFAEVIEVRGIFWDCWKGEIACWMVVSRFCAETMSFWLYVGFLRGKFVKTHEVLDVFSFISGLRLRKTISRLMIVFQHPFEYNLNTKFHKIISDYLEIFLWILWLHCIEFLKWHWENLI